MGMVALSVVLQATSCGTTYGKVQRVTPLCFLFVKNGRRNEMKSTEQGSGVPTVAVVGSSREQLCFLGNLVNSFVAGSIVHSEKNCLSIPVSILLDGRLRRGDEFAVEINTKPFAAKTIHAEVLKVLTRLFCHKRYKAEDIVSEVTEQEFHQILKSNDGSYSLEKVADQISIEEFKEAISQSMKEMEEAKFSFEEQVNSKRKIAKKKAGQLQTAVLREIVFDEMWSELKPEVTRQYYAWLDRIEDTVREHFSNLAGGVFIPERGSVTCGSSSALSALFDASQPFNLVVESFTIVCRPRKELQKVGTFHACFKFAPTPKEETMFSGFNFACNSNSDRILFLLNLEEWTKSGIPDNFWKRVRVEQPVSMILTGAKEMVDDFVNKYAEDFIMVQQEDYDRWIEEAIGRVEEVAAKCKNVLPATTEVTWNSLRFFVEQIDPVQKAVRKWNQSKLGHFTPEGFYKEVCNLVQDTQRSLYFEKLSQVKSTGLSVNLEGSRIVGEIVEVLTRDKAIVNRYLLKNVSGVKSQDVITYYERLQRGQGYTCDEFSLNMKGVVRSVLRKAIPNLTVFLQTEEPLREYFNQPEVYSRVIDRVAYRLSYGNDFIRDALDEVYKEPASFVSTFQSIQQMFLEVFKTAEFRDSIAEEFSKAMAEQVQKALVARKGSVEGNSTQN